VSLNVDRPSAGQRQCRGRAQRIVESGRPWAWRPTDGGWRSPTGAAADRRAWRLVEEPGGCGGQAGGRDGRWRSPAAARGEWQGGGCVRGRGGAQRRGSEEVGDGGRARSKEAPAVMREQEGEFAGDGRCAEAGGGGAVPDLTGMRRLCGGPTWMSEESGRRVTG
jgi:hypothetical protein